MATQRITTTKIAGASANVVYERCRAWSQQRRADLTIVDAADATAVPIDHSDLLPRSVEREIDRFVTALRSHGHELPVVYFSEHIDSWQTADIYSGVFPDGDRGVVELWTRRYGVWCYALPDDGRLQVRLQRELQRKAMRERNPQELRWYVQGLLEAVLAWEGIVSDSVLIVVREGLGGFWTDGEVQSACNQAAAWLT